MSARSVYDSVHTELDAIVNRLVKEFQKELKERQLGDDLNGLMFGKRMDSKHLFREDNRIFSNRIAPEDVPDMTVGIMIDCSGSMGTSKLFAAKQCAYITYAFCRRLSIPCFIVGHRASNKHVELHSVADENSIDDTDKIRIFDLVSGCCNRDGFALRFCLDKLLKQEQKDKVMLVISDGAPNDDGYRLAEGRMDCQAAVSQAIKNGVTTIAAGLGSDAEDIWRVYKEGRSDKDSASFLDISDISRMPKAFVKILNKRLE